MKNNYDVDMRIVRKFNVSGLQEIAKEMLDGGYFLIGFSTADKNHYLLFARNNPDVSYRSEDLFKSIEFDQQLREHTALAYGVPEGTLEE